MVNIAVKYRIHVYTLKTLHFVLVQFNKADIQSMIYPSKRYEKHNNYGNDSTLKLCNASAKSGVDENRQRRKY
jgi:hypothetical protein